jgi:tRNA nucleotidyltransferase (CCA-adding enzyme)
MMRQVKTYRVGGSVRDELMFVDPKDRDYVVVGSKEEWMLGGGFKRVGHDFPVFLHPETGEEYALARTERKTGAGYSGFETETEGVSLTDDLRRRDLTINAMALDEETGELVDPFGGERDLRDRVLRHVDPDGFKEDPVRVLRLARFLARWPGFLPAKDTVKLCREMVEAGELAHLTPERVTAEMTKALTEKSPSRFFVFLRMVGALAVVFPEVQALAGVEQPYEHHPEGDAFVHTMTVMDQAVDWDGTTDPLEAFAALVHDLGKAKTPREKWPHHYGHEEAGYWVVQSMADRLKLSNEYRHVGAMVARYHMHVHKLHELRAKTVLKMYQDVNTKSYSRVTQVLANVARWDASGRGPFYSGRRYDNAVVLGDVFDALDEVKLSNHFGEGQISEMTVHEIKDFLYREKLRVIDATRSRHYDRY